MHRGTRATRGGYPWDARRVRLSDDEPKSAIEIAMQRLREKDREAGVEDKPITDEQREAIAEVRKVYEARLAEAEILHKSKLRGIQDPGEFRELEDNYRRDRDRLTSERDSRIEKIRSGQT